MISPRRSSAPRSVVLAAAVLGLLSMAPAVGDVGGCGETAERLDRDDYAYARKNADCDRCEACGVESARCLGACEPSAPPDVALPATCAPLRRDGVVCLRALESASCERFETFMRDVAPVVPSECDFCRVAPTPAEPGIAASGGAP